MPPTGAAQPAGVRAILHRAVGVVDAAQQADDFVAPDALDACQVAVAQHEAVVSLAADVAVDHILALPLVEGAAPGGQLAVGRAGDNLHRVFAAADEGIHAVAGDLYFHRLAAGQGLRGLFQEPVGQGYPSHEPKIVEQDKRAAASSGRQAR